MKLRMDSQSSSVFDLAIEIRQLISLAHSYMPIADKAHIVVDYLICSVENRAMQRHFQYVDTSTVESTV